MVADGKPPSDDGGNQKRKRIEAGDSSSASKPALLKKPRLDQSVSIAKTRKVRRTNEEKARRANPFSQPGSLRTASTSTVKTKAAVTNSTKRSASSLTEVIEVSSGEDEPRQKKKMKKKKKQSSTSKEPIVLDISSDSDEIEILKKPRPGPSKEKKIKPPPPGADIIELSDSDDAKRVKKETVDSLSSVHADVKGKGKTEIPPLDDFGMDVDVPVDNSMDIEPLFLPSPSKEPPSPHVAEPEPATSETTPLVAEETSKQTSTETSVTGPQRTSSPRTVPVHDDILPPSLTRISPLPAQVKTTPSPRIPDKGMKTTPPLPSTTVNTPAVKIPPPVPVEAPIPVAPVRITSLATAAAVTTIQPLATTAVSKPSSPQPALPGIRPPSSSASTTSSHLLPLSANSPMESPSSSKSLPPRPSLLSIPSSKLRPSLPNVAPTPSSVLVSVSGSGMLRPSLPDPSPPASAPPVQRSLPSLPGTSSSPRHSLPHLHPPPPSSAPPLSGRRRSSLPDPSPSPPSAPPRSLPSLPEQRSTASSRPKTPSFVKKPNIGDAAPRLSQTARKSSGQKRSYSSDSPELHIDFRQSDQGKSIRAKKNVSSSNIAEVIAAAGRNNSRSAPSSSDGSTHSPRLSDGSSKQPIPSSSSSSSSGDTSSVASSRSRKDWPSLSSGSSLITDAINEAGRRNASSLVRSSISKSSTSTVDALNKASRLNAASVSRIRADKLRTSSGSSVVGRSLSKVTPSLPSPRRNKVVEVVPESEPSDDGSDGQETGHSDYRSTMTGISRSLPVPRSKNPDSEVKTSSRSLGSSKPDSKRMGNVDQSEDVEMANVADSALPQDFTMTDVSSEGTLEDQDQGTLLAELEILNQLMLRDSSPSSVADDLNINFPSDAPLGNISVQTPLTSLTEATADLSISQQASSSPPRTPPPPKRPRGRPRKYPLPQSAPIVANVAQSTSNSRDTLAPTVDTALRATSPLEYMDDDEADRLQAKAQERLQVQATQSSVSAGKHASLEANLSEDGMNSEDSSPIRPRRRSRLGVVNSPSPTAPRLRSSRGGSSSTSASHSRANSVEAPRYAFYSETPEESPLRSESPPGSSIRYIDGVAIYTWKEQKALLAASIPKVYWARDIPTALHDRINAMSDITKNLQPMREVLKGVIREHTCEDEPDAPEIDIVNNVDAAATPPWEFFYSNRMWFSDKVDPPTIEGLKGCDCVGPCDPKNKKCACLQRQQASTKDYISDFAYTSQKRLKAPQIPIFECNALCRCDETCRNRVVQAGRKADIRLEKTKDKGWGVFANKKVSAGSYIGIYAGELLTEAEGEARGHDYNRLGRTYLFNLDFWHLHTGVDWDNKYVVDAFHAGNFTRFLNHSCDPNCHLTACYINDPDTERPLLALFALKDIQPGQELTFSYGGVEDDDGGPSSSPKKHEDAVYAACLCGAAKCKKKLFM